jgi:hypothetical protein
MLNELTCFINMFKKLNIFNILLGYVEALNISLKYVNEM